MISRLRGVLLEKAPPLIVVDVGGVGYEVLMPLNTAFVLPVPGKEIEIFTHFVVREDAQQLYGFLETKEREIFRTLIKVNGVGPKMALAILSNIQINDLVRSVRADDASSLEKVPGIGKKTAQRLLVELKDRFKGWEMPASHAYSMGTDSAADFSLVSPQQEAESALLALGYKPQEASKLVLRALEKNTDASAEELIRLALKQAV